MVSRVQTKNDIKDYLDKIKKLRVAIDAADAVIVGAGAGFQHLPALPTTASGLQNIFRTLKNATVFTICIRAVFIRIVHLRNFGLIGRDISISTAI